MTAVEVTPLLTPKSMVASPKSHFSGKNPIGIFELLSYLKVFMIFLCSVFSLGQLTFKEPIL
jgi:hypothetical protein